MPNFAEQPQLKAEKEQKIDKEQFQKETIALIYDNIENLRKGEGLNQDLEKKLPEGKDILKILKMLGKADVMPFLIKFKEKTRETPLDKIPAEHLLLSLLKEGRGFDPNLIELGIILDSLKMKFKKDVIADILKRDYLEKQLSELGPKLPSLEQELLIYGKAYDDLKILMFNKGIKLADFKSLSAKDKEQFSHAEVKFDDITAALDMEIFRAAKKEDEYKNLNEGQYQKFWQRFENLDNALAKAKNEKIKPLNFFQKKDLHFLTEIFADRFDSLAKTKDRSEQLSKEYINNYL